MSLSEKIGPLNLLGLLESWYIRKLISCQSYLEGEHLPLFHALCESLLLKNQVFYKRYYFF